MNQFLVESNFVLLVLLQDRIVFAAVFFDKGHMKIQNNKFQ
jgi:hypothetical protein